MTDAILVVHAATTWGMTGVIWFVQVVHYPLFAYADPDRYPAFQAEHMRRTTWVVAPLMLLEGTTGAWLVADAWSAGLGWRLSANVVLLAGIWVSTALVQVPRHNGLLQAFDDGLHRSLVRGNWMRTAAWTVRSGIVGWMLVTG